MSALVIPQMFNNAVNEAMHRRERHSFCQSTEKYTAWVGNRGQFKRCFAVMKTYPHKTISWHLPDE